GTHVRVGVDEEQGGVAGTVGVDRVVEQVEALAIRGFVVVATVVDHLGLGRVVVFDEHLAVDVVGAVVIAPDAVFGFDEVEATIAAFDPIVTNHGVVGAILQVVSEGTRAQRAEHVVLERNAVGFGVDVVLVRAVDVAVVVDGAAFDEDVGREVPAEEAVAVVVEVEVAEREVVALGCKDAGGVVCETRSGVGVADLEVFDDDVSGVADDVNDTADVGGVAFDRIFGVDR